MTNSHFPLHTLYTLYTLHTLTSFYLRSKDNATFGKNARFLLPKVEGCGG